MKKHLKSNWSIYTIGAFGGFIGITKIDYWWVYIILFGLLINGIEYYAIGMASSSISYIGVSLLTFKKKVNMDKLFNKGNYSIEGELNVVDEEVKIGWKIFGMGKR